MVNINAAVSRLRRHSRSAARLGDYPLKQTARKVISIARLQRFAANMFMDVLDRPRGTDGDHETDDRTLTNYLMRDQATVGRRFKQPKTKYFGIRALCELRHLHRLLDDVARTKAIWPIRYDVDVLIFIGQQFSSPAEMLKLTWEKPARGGWRFEGTSPSTEAMLYDCADHNVTEVSAAAFLRLMQNSLSFKQAPDRNPHAGIVCYENLVTRPIEAFSAHFEFLVIDLWSARSSQAPLARLRSR